eukprot:gene44226-biopygen30312
MRYNSWIVRARDAVRQVALTIPDDATLPERRKAMRAAAPLFHGGTYWGRKKWGQAVREYLERHGQAPRRPPLTAKDAPNFGPDIIFPWKKDA